MRKSTIAALGLVILSLVLSLPASAQAVQNPGCGPLSRWTGQICVGPRGKAYCPQGMSMQGQTCVGAQPAASSQPMTMFARPPGPTNAPSANMTIFHSGNSSTQRFVLPGGPANTRVRLGSGIQQYSLVHQLAPIKSASFTLTPNQPVIEASGVLVSTDSVSGPNETPPGAIVLIHPSLSTASLLLDAVAGKTYAIDETVFVMGIATMAGPGVTASTCVATVTGPDGSVASFPCTFQEQHLVVLYQSTTQGQVEFKTQVNWGTLLYGVTVAPVQL